MPSVKMPSDDALAGAAKSPGNSHNGKRINEADETDFLELLMMVQGLTLAGLNHDKQPLPEKAGLQKRSFGIHVGGDAHRPVMVAPKAASATTTTTDLRHVSEFVQAAVRRDGATTGAEVVAKAVDTALSSPVHHSTVSVNDAGSRSSGFSLLTGLQIPLSMKVEGLTIRRTQGTGQEALPIALSNTQRTLQSLHVLESAHAEVHPPEAATITVTPWAGHHAVFGRSTAINARLMMDTHLGPTESKGTGQYPVRPVGTEHHQVIQSLEKTGATSAVVGQAAVIDVPSVPHARTVPDPVASKPAASEGAIDLRRSDWTSDVARMSSQHMANLSETSLQLKVHPEGMGSIVIHAVHQQDGGVSLNLSVSNPTVANLLNQSLPNLRETIQSQGVDITGVVVSYNASLSQDGQPSGGGRSQHPRVEWVRSRGGGELKSIDSAIPTERIGGHSLVHPSTSLISMRV